MPGELKAVAPGCVVAWADFSNIVTTSAVFFCFFSFGSCVAGLGAALPQLADRYGVEETDLGYIFIARGIGYLIGTIFSAGVIEVCEVMKKYQLLVLSIGVLSSGLALGIMSGISSIVGMYALITLQGFGFGFVDTVGNIILPELWGSRVQAAHAQFGIGGIVGPALVGVLGYKDGFILLALLSAAPLFITLSQDAIETLGILVMSRHLAKRNGGDGKGIDDSYNMGTDSPYASVLDNDEEALKAKSAQRRHNSSSETDTTVAVTSDGDGVEGVFVLPLSLKVLLASFFFIYVGMEIGFAGWISSYAVMSNLTDSRAKAAYITSVFFSALALGRVLAIPLAVYVSNTMMLRAQLALTLVSALLVVGLAPLSYNLAVFSSALMGLACSSLFPLVMTLIGDYGYTMDTSATTMFVVGSTFGEAIIPVCIGVVMHFTGPQALMYCTLSISIMMTIVYIAAHVLLSGKGPKQHDATPLHDVDRPEVETENGADKADMELISHVRC